MGSGMTAAQAVSSGSGTIGTIAATGSTNADAAIVTGDSSYVTAADGTKGVKLFDCEVGSKICVFNFAASILKVYPPASQQLNNLTASSGSVSIAANKGGMFVKLTNNSWGVVYA